MEGSRALFRGSLSPSASRGSTLPSSLPSSLSLSHLSRTPPRLPASCAKSRQPLPGGARSNKWLRLLSRRSASRWISTGTAGRDAAAATAAIPAGTIRSPVAGGPAHTRTAPAGRESERKGEVPPPLQRRGRRRGGGRGAGGESPGWQEACSGGGGGGSTGVRGSPGRASEAEKRESSGLAEFRRCRQPWLLLLGRETTRKSPRLQTTAGK